MTALQNSSLASVSPDAPIFIRPRTKNALTFFLMTINTGFLAYLAISNDRTNYLIAAQFVCLLLSVYIYRLWFLIEKRPLAIVAESGLTLPSLFDGAIPWRCIRDCSFSEKQYLGYPAVLRIFVYPGAYDGILRRLSKTLPADHFDIDLANCTPDADIVVAAVAARIVAAHAAQPRANAVDLVHGHAVDLVHGQQKHVMPGADQLTTVLFARHLTRK